MNNIVIPTLEPDDIEVKIKQVTQKGAFALLYKTARTDMRILDEAYGINNWQVDYQMIGDMLFCTIHVWDEEKGQWIHKQSNGIESREDGEGNEKKGWSSDAMKRAGFMFSIGRELYSSPKVFLNVATKQDGEFKGKPVYKLEDPWATYIVTDIAYDNKRKITRLIIANERTGEVVYRYGDTQKKATKPAPKQEKAKDEKNEQPKPVPTETAQEQSKPVIPENVEKTKTVVEVSKTIPNENKPPHQLLFEHFLNKHGIDRERFMTMRAEAVKAGKNVTMESLKVLPPDGWVTLLANMEALYEEGFFRDAT